MLNTDYGKYLVRKPEYEGLAGIKNRQSPVMTILSDKQVPGCNYYIEAGWIYGIPRPNPAFPEQVNDYDEIIIHLGGNYETPYVLGGEVEFFVGGQPVTFNTSTSFFIPKGTPYGPVTWKKFVKPHLQISIKCGTGKPGGTAATGNTTPVKKKAFDFEQYAIRSPMREAGAEFTFGRTAPTMTFMSGVQIPGVTHYIETGWTFGMPVSKVAGSGMPEMVHRKFDEIVLHIGGDPERPEELGGEVEFYVGGQPLVFNTTSALFIPTGVKHGPLSLKKYEKPHLVMAIMCGASNIKDGWGDSFKT